jgi:ubiquinone/menaquinone biosynthesis C-methylase UbiE
MSISLDKPIIEKLKKKLEEDFDDSIEIEIRFGSFLSNNNFHPGILYHDFCRIKQALYNNDKYEVKKTKTEVKNYRNNIRQIRNIETNEIIWMKKQVLNRQNDIINIRDYNFRISFAQEKIIDKKVINEEPENIRIKDRTSFIAENYRIDMTILETGITELEVEFLPGVNLNVTTLIEPVKMMLKMLQDTPHIYSQIEYDDVVEYFNTFFENDINFNVEPGKFFSRFINKPGDLINRDIKIISKGNYAITDKADGERFFLMINEDGIWLVNPNSKIRKYHDDEHPLDNYIGTLIDGELIKVSNKHKTIHVFLAFDILFYRKKDVRNRTLFERLFLVKQFAKSYPEDASRMLCYIPKQFFFEYDFYTNIRNAFDFIAKVPYENDGLIFTPMDNPYFLPKGKKTYKWKPPNKLTIDFQSVKVRGQDNEYHLYASFYDVNIQQHRPVQFQGSRNNPYNKSVHIEPETKLDGCLIFPDKQIIEYIWNGDNFEPYRLRADKEKPNAIRTCEGIWNLIHHPVLVDTLIGKDLDLLRKYHNIIKREMIVRLGSNLTVLDIGSGRGGDIHKYKAQNIKIYAVDPNDDNLNEMKKRVKDIGYGENVTFISAGGEETNKIAKYVEEEVDVVTSFFSLTFFFKNKKMVEQLIQTVDRFLKDDGYFIGTTMDGNNTYELMLGQDSITTDYYEIIKKYHDDGKIGFEKQIQIDMKGTIVSSQTEYLVDFKKFVRLLAKKNIYLISTSMFDPDEEAPYLSDEQKALSGLYRKFVFQKGLEPNDPNIIDIKTMDVKKKYPDMRILVPDEMMNFPNEFADDLVRVGVVPDGSCFFHTIFRGKSKTYKEMTLQEKMIFIANIRQTMAEKLSFDTFKVLGKGELAYQKSMIIFRSLIEKYMVGEENIITDEEFIKKIGNVAKELEPATFDNFKNRFFEIFDDILDNDSKESVNKIFELSLMKAYQKYKIELAHPRFPVSNDISEFVSDQLGVDVYFINSNTRQLYLTADECKRVYKNRLSIIVLSLGNYHYELLARLSDTKLRTSFEPDDPLIKKLQKNVCDK